MEEEVIPPGIETIQPPPSLGLVTSLELVDLVTDINVDSRVVCLAILLVGGDVLDHLQVDHTSCFIARPTKTNVRSFGGDKRVRDCLL